MDKQEPVAWMVYTLDGTAAFVTLNPADFTGEHRALPLYTTPPPARKWVGLTDEEIKALPNWWPSYEQMPALMTLARDIESLLKEKNGG